MKIFGIAGWSGSGKTTLIAQILPIVAAQGLRVSTVKHASHDFEIDKPGKDSFIHREAGATEVLVTAPRRWALMHENRSEPEARLDDLIARMTPVDLVLVEGFKAYPHPKIEVHQVASGKPLLCGNDPHIVAVASDAPIAHLPVPRFDLGDAPAIADFILSRVGLKAA